MAISTSWFLVAGLVSAPLLAQTAPPSSTPAAKSDDVLSKAVNVPGVNWQVYGANQTSKIVKVQGVPGDSALHVNVAAKSANAWDIGAVSPIQKPIAAGDVILIAAWMRAPALKDGETTSIPFLGATAATAPYAGIASADVRIGNGWKMFYATGKAATAFAPGAAQASVHLGANKHAVELGPIFVLDFGPNQDINKLPKN
jgi:hypothetical protein